MNSDGGSTLKVSYGDVGEVALAHDIADRILSQSLDLEFVVGDDEPFLDDCLETVGVRNQVLGGQFLAQLTH